MKNSVIFRIFYVTAVLCFFQILCSQGTYAIEYEIRSTFLEPLEGRTYYPGNKLFINLQLRDINERVASIAFYVTPPGSKRPRDPFFVDKDGSDGWFTNWIIPKDTPDGWYRISAQAFDKNGVRKGIEASVPVMIKKPAVQLRVTSPPKEKKFYGGQTVYVTGSLVDRAGLAKRVDFYLHRANADTPEKPSYSDTKLSGGCTAKFVLPEKPLDQYEVLLKAYDSETEGSLLAEDRISFLLVQPEVEVRVAEPRSGSIFYPGQKIHIFGSLRDPAKATQAVRFYLYGSDAPKPAKGSEKTPQKQKGLTPFAVEEHFEGGFSAEYDLPYEIEFGPHTLIVEAAGSGEGSPALARDERSLFVKKPEIRMNVRVPSPGAYYYPGEDLYINVELEDRAAVVERVAFVIFPRGEPLASTFTYFDKIFSDGCGAMFKLPDNVKPGKYVLQITAKDLKGESLQQKNVEFEIRK